MRKLPTEIVKCDGIDLSRETRVQLSCDSCCRFNVYTSTRSKTSTLCMRLDQHSTSQPSAHNAMPDTLDLLYATADEADAYMFYRFLFFVFFCFFPSATKYETTVLNG